MTPSVLITGGNRGVGLEIHDFFSPTATSVSRSNGYDIGKKEDRERICRLSLSADIFINHAHNGHFEGQTLLLYEVFNLWSEKNKSGYIVSTGSIVTYQHQTNFKRYSILKKALEIANQQCCKKLENGLGSFRMTLLKPGMLDTVEAREKPHWPGHGLKGHDIAKIIDSLYKTPQDLLIPEVVLSSIAPAKSADFKV